MNLKKIISSNIKDAEKAIRFLRSLNDKLLYFSSEKTENFVIMQKKVSYYNIDSFEYLLYDYDDFNTVLRKIYFDDYLESKILENNIYWCFKHCMDYIFSKSNYRFHENLFSTFHLVSWFIKSLKLTNEKNEFDVKRVLRKYQFPFLDSQASIEQNYDLIVDFINALQNIKVIDIIDLKMIFKSNYLDDLDFLLNISLEPLTFCGDMNVNKIKITPYHIDFSYLNNPNISELRKFQYIIALYINYISHVDLTNNTYVDN